MKVVLQNHLFLELKTPCNPLADPPSRTVFGLASIVPLDTSKA